MSHRVYKKALRAAAEQNPEIRDRLILAHEAEIERIERRLAQPAPEPNTRAYRRERLGMQQKVAAIRQQIIELRALTFP